MGERFIFASAWLWMTLTDWNCGILGRAPVEFKELVVADLEGDCDDDVGPLLVLTFTSLPFTMFVLLWLWLMVLLEDGSRRRKCLNENGFSFGASVGCLKSKNNKNEMTNEELHNFNFYFTQILVANAFSTKVAALAIPQVICVQLVLVFVLFSHQNCEFY